MTIIECNVMFMLISKDKLGLSLTMLSAALIPTQWLGDVYWQAHSQLKPNSTPVWAEFILIPKLSHHPTDHLTLPLRNSIFKHLLDLVGWNIAWFFRPIKLPILTQLTGNVVFWLFWLPILAISQLFQARFWWCKSQSWSTRLIQSN